MSNQHHSRQILLWGHENQRKLKEASLCIVGSSLFAQYVAASSVALGVGEITLVSNRELSMWSKSDFLTENNKIGTPAVYSMKRMLSRLNPHLSINALAMPYAEEVLTTFNPDIVIHTHEKKGVAISEDTPWDSIMLHEPKHEPQNDLESGILAGLLTHAIRKAYFTLERESNEISFDYQPCVQSLPQKKILLVGAGALGNFVGLGLMKSGAHSIDIIDYDSVETSNLNRQIMLYDAIGESKSKILGRRLSSLQPRINITAIHDAFSSAFDNKGYDIVLGCVDSARVRREISDWSMYHNVPYIDGGTSSLSGSVDSYVPGKSPCITCQKNLDTLIDHEMSRNTGCAQSSPSVITPNIIIGSYMVDRASRILSTRQAQKKLSYCSRNHIYETENTTQKSECKC